jgi:serine protease SohB
MFFFVCLVKSDSSENKLTKKKFKITKYKTVNTIDKKLFTYICVNNCEKNKSDKYFFLKKLFLKKPIDGQLATKLTEEPKTKYLYYIFDNLSVASDQFEKLENFVNITLNTCQSDSFEIFLKISSPGGVAYQFEKAYSNLMRLKNKGFKLTALIDDVCASGGYMLACACDKIICSQYAKIGSIGVRADTTNCHRLLKDKLGIEYKTFKTGDYKDMIPFGEECTQEHIDRMTETMNETLQDFKNIVQTNRKLSDDQMKNILSAKVWTGNMAKENGLVDEIMMPATYIETFAEDNEIFVITPEDEKESYIKDLLNVTCGNLMNKVTSNCFTNVVL